MFFHRKKLSQFDPRQTKKLFEQKKLSLLDLTQLQDIQKSWPNQKQKLILALAYPQE
jgi:hypothetical protein